MAKERKPKSCSLLLAFAVMSLLKTATPSIAATNEPTIHDGFADAAAMIEGLRVDMRYHGSLNFVGQPIAGYEDPICLLTVEAAKSLAQVQESLRPFGFGLKIFDCYRPAQAVEHFVRWASDPHDEKRKLDHYPDIPKTELFARGYIAEQSSHSRGSTVDVTIIDLVSEQELDMGTSYDWFGPQSWPSYQSVSSSVRNNRMLLRLAMEGAQFMPYEQEWWHFTLKNESHPDTYFDFPVRRPAKSSDNEAD